MKNLKQWARERILKEEELQKFLWDRKYLLGALLLALAAIVFFGSYLRMALTMLLLIALGFSSLLYNKFLRISLGFELIVLVTVLAGMAYGTLAAFIVGAIALFVAEVFNGSFQHSTIVSFIGLAVIAAAIPQLSGMSVTTIGLLMTLLYNAILAPGYLLLGSQPWKVGVFVITDIFFNAWVFILLAPRLVGLMG